MSSAPKVTDAMRETLAELARIRRLESDALDAAEAWFLELDGDAALDPPLTVAEERLILAVRALREAKK